MAARVVYVALLAVMLSKTTLAVYLSLDYFMDDDWPEIFGSVCQDTIRDDCAFVNSHLHTFGLVDYDSNMHCVATLDAGKQRGARYKLSWRHFGLDGGACLSHDYLQLYDADAGNVSAETLVGTFCGAATPNTSGHPTGRYATLVFRTDGHGEHRGFRVMITRTLPYPCTDDYYHCRADNRCIDGRLRCDGIAQCADGADESSCSFFEKLLGGFLALGVAGIVGVTLTVVCCCTGVGVTVCICTCCRRRCDCLFRCCANCRRKSRELVERTRRNRIGVSSTKDTDEPGVTEGTAKPGVTGGTAKPGVTGETAKPGVTEGTAKPGVTEVTTKPGVTEVITKPGVTGNKLVSDDGATSGTEADTSTEDKQRITSLTTEPLVNNAPGDEVVSVVTPGNQRVESDSAYKVGPQLPASAGLPGNTGSEHGVHHTTADIADTNVPEEHITKVETTG